MSETKFNGPYKITHKADIRLDEYGIYAVSGFMAEEVENPGPLFCWMGGFMSSANWYRYLASHYASYGLSSLLVTPPQPKKHDLGMWLGGYDHARLFAIEGAMPTNGKIIAAGHSWGGNMAIIEAGNIDVEACIACAPGWADNGPDPAISEIMRESATYLSCPTLFLAGTLDKNTGVRAAQKHLEKAPPGLARLETLEGVIHASYIGNPTAYYAAAMLEESSHLSHSEMLSMIVSRMDAFLVQKGILGVTGKAEVEKSEEKLKKDVRKGLKKRDIKEKRPRFGAEFEE